MKTHGSSASRLFATVRRSGCLIVLALLSASFSLPQTITTVAGNGNMSFSGDGGQATLASLNRPAGVAIDPSGAMVIADTNNWRVRRVTPGGFINTVAGDGVFGESGDGSPAIDAWFSDVFGPAFDSAGNLYVADADNRRVRRVTADGIVTTVAGTGVQGNSGDGGPATAATLNRPIAVALDTAGNLYICDSSNHNIRRVNLATGIIGTYAGKGTPGFSGDGSQATLAALQYPLGLAIDRLGNLYIADAGNNCIRKVGANSVITTIAGNGGAAGFAGDGGAASASLMNLPSGVAVDGSGNLFISDSGNNRVRRIDSSGLINTIAGSFASGFSGDNGPAVNASLNYPWGTTIDGSGNIYVGDYLNNRIRRISGAAAAGLPLPPPTQPVSSSMPEVTALSPAAATGTAEMYSLQISDASGWQDVNIVNVLINHSLDGRQACYLAYSPSGNTVYLVNDAGSGLLPGMLLNGSGTISNSQCSVAGAGSSSSGNGNTLTLNLNLTFSSSFAGDHVVYAAARSLTLNSGWQTMGVLGVPPLPSSLPNAISMSPSSGNSASATIAFTYADATSATNLQTAWALINNALDGRSACYLVYYRPGNQVFLYPDSGDPSQAASMSLTGPNTLSNSQCSVSAQGSSVAVSGSQMTVSLNVAFKPSFAGPKAVWMAVQTMGGSQTSQWRSLGAWNVP